MYHRTPEAAALSTWEEHPNAAAHVEAVTVRGRRAEVVIDTDPSYPDYVYCQHASAGWYVTISGNGPCVGWDDPDHIQWDDPPDVQ